MTLFRRAHDPQARSPAQVRRRLFLRAGGLSGILALTTILALFRSPSDTAGPFPQYGARSTHNAAFSGTIGTWRVPVTGRAVFEAAYDPDTQQIFVDTLTRHRGWLYALNAQTGRILWRWHAPNQLMDTPILNPAGTHIFVGWGNGQMSYLTPHGVGNAFAVRGTGSSGVAAFNAQTGRMLWHHTTRGAVMPTLTYYRGAVYVATGHRYFDGWDAITGRPLLHQWVAGFDSMSATPITATGIAVVPVMAPAAVWGIQVPSGRILWTRANPAWTGGLTDTNPLILGQTVWLSSLTAPLTEPTLPLGASVGVAAIALNTQTGRIVHQIALGHGPRPIHTETGNYTYADGLLFLTSPITNTVYAIVPASGRIMWEFRAGTPIRAGVLVIRQHVFVPTGHTLWVLNAQNGTIEQSHSFPTAIRFGIDSPIQVGMHIVLALPTAHNSTIVSWPLTAHDVMAPTAGP